jgi:hypothetical protein
MAGISNLAASHEARLSVVESAVIRIENAVDKIADALTILTRVEAKSEAVAAEIQDLQEYTRGMDARMQSIETKLPPLLEVRSWIIKALMGVGALIGSALFGMVIMNNAQSQKVVAFPYPSQQPAVSAPHTPVK